MEFLNEKEKKRYSLFFDYLKWSKEDAEREILKERTYKTLTITGYSQQEIIEQLNEQPRLQEFFEALYTNKNYNLNDFKGMDKRNFGIAIYILNEIYPQREIYNAYKNQK